MFAPFTMSTFGRKSYCVFIFKPFFWEVTRWSPSEVFLAFINVSVAWLSYCSFTTELSSFMILARVAIVHFNLLCRAATSLFNNSQFLRPQGLVYLSCFLLTIISSILFAEELLILFMAVVALSKSVLALRSVSCRLDTSFVMLARSDFWSLCFARIPHEKADRHGPREHGRMNDKLWIIHVF